MNNRAELEDKGILKIRMGVAILVSLGWSKQRLLDEIARHYADLFGGIE